MWAQIRNSYPDGLREIVGGGAFGWPAGHATDDTDVTRAIVLAYLAPGDDRQRPGRPQQPGRRGRPVGPP